MRDGDESLRPLPSLTFQGRPSCSLAPSMPKSCTRGVDSQAGAGGNGGGAAVRVGMGNGRPLVTAGDASGLRHGSGSRSSGANSSGVLAKRADRVLVTRFAPRGGLSDLASFARGGGGRVVPGCQSAYGGDAGAPGPSAVGLDVFEGSIEGASSSMRGGKFLPW